MISNYLLNIYEKFHEVWLTFRHKMHFKTLKFKKINLDERKMIKRTYGILSFVKHWRNYDQKTKLLQYANELLAEIAKTTRISNFY